MAKMKVSLPISGRLLPASFLTRKRFLVSVSLEGDLVTAFLPNTGRLSEILMEGSKVILKSVPLGRKVRYDLVVGFDGQTPVVVDSRIPNMLVKIALESRAFPELSGYSRILSEVRVLSSRLDFRLTNGESTYLEVKGVTMARGSEALYPDAPTERGVHHLQVLQRLVRAGVHGIVFFLAMRSDVEEFMPNFEVDPAFAAELEKSRKSGVKVLCYRCGFVEDKVVLGKRLAYD